MTVNVRIFYHVNYVYNILLTRNTKIKTPIYTYASENVLIKIDGGEAFYFG
jgi:hypothetical protein